MSQSRGRDECVDGSIGSGPKCCFGIKSGEEQAGLENWLWRVSRQGKKTGHSVQRPGTMGSDMHQKPAERVDAILCWGWVGWGLGFMLEEIAGRPALSLAVTHPSGFTSASPAEG